MKQKPQQIFSLSGIEAKELCIKQARADERAKTLKDFEHNLRQIYDACNEERLEQIRARIGALGFQINAEIKKETK